MTEPPHFRGNMVAVQLSLARILCICCKLVLLGMLLVDLLADAWYLDEEIRALGAVDYAITFYGNKAGALSLKNSRPLMANITRGIFVMFALGILSLFARSVRYWVSFYRSDASSTEDFSATSSTKASSSPAPAFVNPTADANVLQINSPDKKIRSVRVKSQRSQRSEQLVNKVNQLSAKQQMSWKGRVSLAYQSLFDPSCAHASQRALYDLASSLLFIGFFWYTFLFKLPAEATVREHVAEENAILSKLTFGASSTLHWELFTRPIVMDLLASLARGHLLFATLLSFSVCGDMYFGAEDAVYPDEVYARPTPYVSSVVNASLSAQKPSGQHSRISLPGTVMLMPETPLFGRKPEDGEVEIKRLCTEEDEVEKGVRDSLERLQLLLRRQSTRRSLRRRVRKKRSNDAVSVTTSIRSEMGSSRPLDALQDSVTRSRVEESLYDI